MNVENETFLRQTKNKQTQFHKKKIIRLFLHSLRFLCHSCVDSCDIQTQDIVWRASCLREKCLKCKHDNVVQLNEQQQLRRTTCQSTKWVCSVLVCECN